MALDGGFCGAAAESRTRSTCLRDRRSTTELQRLNVVPVSVGVRSMEIIISRLAGVYPERLRREQLLVLGRADARPVDGVETLTVAVRLLPDTLGLLGVRELHCGAPNV